MSKLSLVPQGREIILPNKQARPRGTQAGSKNKTKTRLRRVAIKKRMKRILGILICLFLCVGVTFAQKISDVTARQVGKQIHITYTLDEPAEISLYLSTDGGESYIKLIKVSGAVGQSVTSGRNTIVWNVLEERENLVGDNIVFKVRAEGATVTDIDGNVYKTVKLGNQVWMAENLRTTRYANGTTIPLGAGASYRAHRYYPDANSANVADYGYLYNWAAVMYGSASSEANPSGVQGICPNGWHVPSDAEWTELTNYVKSQSQYVCGVNTNYIAKALASETGWYSYEEECHVGNDPSANNATGFSARPAGKYDDYYGSDSNVGGNAYFWSATQYFSEFAYGRYLDYSDANVGRNYYFEALGYSVRCVRNEEGSGSEGGGDNEDGDDNDTTVTAQPCPGAPTVTDVDGNVYNTVQIGEQCWMRENLKTTKYANGTTIPLGTTTSDDVAYRYYPNGNSANVTDYGYLYNWAAVMNGANSSEANPSGVQGICPNGWHVPSDAEWTELENYVSSQSQYVCGSDEDNIAKALASEVGWYNYTENCAVGDNPSANNATGFSARPAGFYSGNYSNVGDGAYFWSATQNDSNYVYYRGLSYSNAYVYGYNYYYFKNIGYSVRCIRN